MLRQEARDRSLLAQKHQDNPAVRIEAASQLIRIAELLPRDGPLDQARSTLNEAIGLLGDPANDDPKNLRWRQVRARSWETLARVQARSGRADEAAGRAVELAQDLARTDPAYLYDLACMLSARALVSRSEADAAAAVVALRRAIDAGFDNDHLLRSDTRLEGLRDRPDFPAPISAPTQM